MKQKCIIVDDDEFSRTIVKQFVQKTEILELAGEFGSAIEAADALRKQKIDILFLDVEMPDMTGIEFIQSMQRKPAIIMITAKDRYAVAAFEHEVVDYILKPFSHARFLKAVNRATASLEEEPQPNREHVFVKIDGRYCSLTVADILYIEAKGDYVSIVMSDQKHLVHSTLTAMFKKLGTSHFMRIHRSFVVNTEMISTVEDDTVIIKGRIIPIGSIYKEELHSHLGL
jgi:DNA-binding LytR/AlgR family response regulator